MRAIGLFALEPVGSIGFVELVVLMTMIVLLNQIVIQMQKVLKQYLTF
jgi:hypothetical protein